MNKPNVGDFFVVHTTGFAARLIQLGTWSKWNHAGIYIGDDMIIEARPRGVTLSHISKYDNHDILWSTEPEPPFTEAEGEKLRQFALIFVGDSYNIWSIIALGFKSLGISLFPAIKRANNIHSVICSQLVACIWSHMGRKLSDRQHALVRPRDLALKIESR
jgi:hypothetical protein